VVKDALTLWLHQNVQEAELIATVVLDAAQARLRQGKAVARKRVTAGPQLPGKLADCTGEDMRLTELFLVEGDSAGGSAKQARDKEIQAIMPLRGKILNTWEVSGNDVLASQEVHDIAIAIGVDPGSDKLDQLRYGKVCILADADSDGAHIATLLCALFLKHFKPFSNNKIILVKTTWVKTPVCFWSMYRPTLPAHCMWDTDVARHSGHHSHDYCQPRATIFIANIT
jgi:topoisomerase-4 subunit B